MKHLLAATTSKFTTLVIFDDAVANHDILVHGPNLSLDKMSRL